MISFLDVLFLIIAGRLLIFLWMKFPVPEWFEKSRWGTLHECQLCSGVWGYTLLFLMFRVDLLGMTGLPYVMGVSELIAGGAISYLTFLLEIGFREYHVGIVIE